MSSPLWPPLTVASQALLSMGFSREENSSELPCPSPEDLPHPGIEPASPALQVDSLSLSYQGSPDVTDCFFSTVSQMRLAVKLMDPFMEKEMATHSSVLAWRIPGMGEPGGLPSMGSHRVGHDWSDLAAAALLHWTMPTLWDPVFSREYSRPAKCFVEEKSAQIKKWEQILSFTVHIGFTSNVSAYWKLPNI